MKKKKRNKFQRLHEEGRNREPQLEKVGAIRKSMQNTWRKKFLILASLEKKGFGGFRTLF